MKHEVVSLLNGERLSQLQGEVSLVQSNEIFCTDKRNVWELRSKDLKNFKVLHELSSEIRKQLESRAKVGRLRLDKIWFQITDSSVADQTILPYVPHFDKYRFLKGMVYLDDVNPENGPIHFGEYANHFKVDEVRRRLPFKHKELGLNLVQPRELRDVPSPVLGKAGDVVLFDTSAPHKAGTVAEGHIRRVVRFDFEHWSFNSALRTKDRLRKLIPSFS